MLSSNYSYLILMHVTFGFIGLISYWIAALAKKGSPIHVKSGWAFAWTMYILAVTSSVMAFAVIQDPEVIHPGQDPGASRRFAAFLFFLGILSAAVTRNGVQFMRHKKDLSLLKNPLDIALNLACLICGSALLLKGLLDSDYLFVAFGVLAWMTSGGHLYFLLSALKPGLPRMTYFFSHFGNMIGAGIAIHTAFLAGGAAGRYFPWLVTQLDWSAWLIPTGVGIIMQVILRRHYTKLYGSR